MSESADKICDNLARGAFRSAGYRMLYIDNALGYSASQLKRFVDDEEQCIIFLADRIIELRSNAQVMP